MAYWVHFVTGTVVSSAFLNGMQEAQSASAHGLTVVALSTTLIGVQPASDGSAEGMTSFMLNGVPCYSAATVSKNVAELADGEYDIYAVAPAPPAFELLTQAKGGAAPATSRHLGVVNVAAGAIVSLSNEVDSVSGHSGRHAAGAVDALPPAAVALEMLQAELLEHLAVSNAVIPAGTMKVWGGNAAPAGWLLCDGSAVSRTEYAALFAAIGTVNGAGDGATTFNLPDMRGRVAVGADDMGTPAGAAGRLTVNGARGDVGGEAAHLLSAGEMPAHAHGVSDPGHAHGVSDPGHAHGVSDPGHAHDTGFTKGIKGGTGGEYVLLGEGYNYPSTTSGTGVSIQAAATGVGVQGATTKVVVQDAGGGAAHNNMQPYQVHHYIIKT